MSLACGAECVVCVGCSRWMWKRCTYVGSDDSATWPLATREELEPIPRICRVILAVYEEDLSNPKYAPSGGYRMDASCVVKRVTYEQTQGCAPPYIIYVDHAAQEIIMAIRGLNLVKESDYKLLLDNRLGQQMFDGGYVHHGLLKSAVWILNQESETLKRLWLENGKRYKMVFLGHSLGSGVAALLAIVVVNHREKLGGMPRNFVRCYAVAPARCVSLNLAVKYADIIHSVILQDDFLPRTPTPLEDIFGSIFCLPCLMFLICLRDTFLPEHRKLRDPRRLYAPGRMYHIVERKFCRGHALCIQAVQKVNVAMYMTHLRNQLALFIRCGRYPPEVRTAIPVEGRFEHIVLSCNATSDHAIIWIEREAQKALDRMKESSQTTTPPLEQRMVRQETLEKEHVAALEKAVSLNVPHAATPTEETGEESVATTSHDQNEGSMLDQDEGSPRSESKSCTRTNWDELVEKLFTRSESGHLVLKKDINIVQ